MLDIPGPLVGSVDIKRLPGTFPRPEGVPTALSLDPWTKLVHYGQGRRVDTTKVPSTLG